MAEVTLKQIVEGLLLAAPKPLTVEELRKIIAACGTEFALAELPAVIAELAADYRERGVELKEVASGWRFQVKAALSPWINKMYEERPPRYSRALLETLALIAYRQPLTRAEIEEVRGVAVSSNIIKTLLEHEWIRVVGYKELPGKPALFATTKKFLDHFNLKSLAELPELLEFTENLEESQLATKEMAEEAANGTEERVELTQQSDIADNGVSINQNEEGRD